MSDRGALEQVERAQKRWALVVLEKPVEPKRIKALRRALRLKSFEAQDLERKIPGPVRYGARVDLAPLLERLKQAGIEAEIRETATL